MRLQLTRHPDYPSLVGFVVVDVAQPLRGLLALRYSVFGATERLKLPMPADHVRTDELWKHTCFEAFVRPSTDACYYEFNFAPSSAWAAYQFKGYRAGMGTALGVPAPEITTASRENQFELEAKVDVSGLPELADAPAWRLALTAVIEETDGVKSYWALAHPPGKPDFHHADGFGLELP
jgi:hypothetical protein